ncbi:DUF6362 family protein [Rhizobium brockwellii]|uniref:DUF6362 family protein n=1 Tax=Rhizobium brockwellii TaxID=3019932 RepID=A0ABU3YWQ3_9HYPH|nr:DUF6362 family protein [Rhizobium brockwellii]MDV4183279.1 DUF6362 family protein [Rhizobium brockwellii]MDV4190290.1 DUF6362 family protein [Rhizobium brockwellii]
MTMVFAEWTYEQVRAQIIEAAYTLRASPGDLGPRLRGGAMSDVVRDMTEAYGYGEAKVPRIPTAGAISRMYETWDWVNAYLNEEQRKRVYEYAFIKTRKGIYLDAYLKKIDMSRSTFERRIQSDCQCIANNLNQKHRVRLTVALDAVTEIDLKPTSITVASKNCATDWRDDEVTSQKEQVRADVLAHAHWRNERRRQLIERAER